MMAPIPRKRIKTRQYPLYRSIDRRAVLNMAPARSGSTIVLNVIMNATIKNVLNANKCGPDVVIAVMIASNSFSKKGNSIEELFGPGIVWLTCFEIFELERIFPSNLVAFMDAALLGDDVESFSGIFHNGSLIFIPKNPFWMLVVINGLLQSQMLTDTNEKGRYIAAKIASILPIRNWRRSSWSLI